jgi:hypothetical protein
LALEGHVPSPQVWAIAQVIVNTLGPMVREPKTKILVSFKCPSYYISLVCQFQTNGLGIDYNETQDFNGELQVF